MLCAFRGSPRAPFDRNAPLGPFKKMPLKLSAKGGPRFFFDLAKRAIVLRAQRQFRACACKLYCIWSRQGPWCPRPLHQPWFRLLMAVLMSLSSFSSAFVRLSSSSLICRCRKHSCCAARAKVWGETSQQLVKTAAQRSKTPDPATVSRELPANTSYHVG